MKWPVRDSYPAKSETSRRDLPNRARAVLSIRVGSSINLAVGIDDWAVVWVAAIGASMKVMKVRIKPRASAATAIRMSKRCGPIGNHALRAAADVLGGMETPVESLKKSPESEEAQNVAVQ